MSNRASQQPPESAAPEEFQPDPDARYSLDAAAQLAGVSLHTLEIYYREGLVRADLRGSPDTLEFTEEAILMVRRIEQLRAGHDLDAAWLKTLIELLDEIERLRAEVRFLRG